MFEQTLLPDDKDARKPYSMVLSLVIQILILGALSAVPFVFTQVLPLVQMKSVLAAPRPPVVVTEKHSAVRTTTSAPRLFRVQDVPGPVQRPLPSTMTHDLGPAPSVTSGDVIGDPNGVAFGAEMGTVGPEPEPPTIPSVKRPATKIMKVGGIVAAANLIHRVDPQYPQMARSVRVQGVVEFTATISKEGSIENLTLVRGHPLLVNAARQAVLQWRYRPTLLNGEPAEVVTDIIVTFTLSQ